MFEKECEYCGETFSLWDWLFTRAYEMHVTSCRIEHLYKPTLAVEVPKPSVAEKFRTEEKKSWPPPPVTRVHSSVPAPRPVPTPVPSSGCSRTQRQRIDNYGTRVSEYDYCDNSPSLLETLIVADVVERVIENVFDNSSSFTSSSDDSSSWSSSSSDSYSSSDSCSSSSGD